LTLIVLHFMGHWGRLFLFARPIRGAGHGAQQAPDRPPAATRMIDRAVPA